jgi:hypothetical protein
VSNVDHAEELDEPLMLLPGQQLRQAISNHTCCRHPADSDAPGFHFLSQPEMVNIDVSQLRVEAGVLGGEQSDCSLIIALDRDNVRCVEADMF